jgi:5-methyltetrahydrofolate--homocysteine methyltransferase
MLDIIYANVVKGDLKGVREAVEQALKAGQSPNDILNLGMISAMQEVGRRFESQEFFIPEMLIAARAMQGGLEVLRPYLVESEIEAVGKIVLGTVKGDLHDIGKNMVGMVMEGSGFEVVDLGVDVYPEKFIAAIEEHQPDFVGLSALLTTTMPAMQATIDAINKAGIREHTIVMVGGAPVNQAFADKIGADIYAANAASAAKMARDRLKK